MLRRIAALCATLLLCGLLCGCDLFTLETDELLNPPELTGDMYPIRQALADSVGGDYTLVYPSNGDRRSAVILNDIDGDGGFEAFAFYSTAGDGAATMHVNMIRRVDGEWSSAAEYSFTAGGVDRVDFCDLDGDGVEELLVGWETYAAGERQLAVYSFREGALSQRMLQSYTEFLCCDLNQDGGNEVFIQLISTADTVNRAALYRLEENGVSEVGSCLMDRNVRTVSGLIYSELSSGQPAIYADEVKPSGAVTEVLFFQKGELVNPLLDSTTGENDRTLRGATLRCQDINRDGILEIPVLDELAATVLSNAAEKSYYTRWCSYNGEVLTDQLTVLMNQNDGYYLSVPGKWVGNISVERDTERRSRSIYAYSAEGGAGELLAFVQALSLEQWEENDDADTMLTELCRSDDTVYVGWASDSGSPLSVTVDDLKKILNLIS